MKSELIALLLLLSANPALATDIDAITSASPQQEDERIDRKAVLGRHNPLVEAIDTLASLSVGNGHFATTVDATGMQTFPRYYSHGVPLCAMSDWGWHSFPNTDSLREEESWQTMRFPHRDHDETYAVEYGGGGRPQAATLYYRANPHRLNLGTIGLSLPSLPDSALQPSLPGNIRQQLNLYEGVIDSRFTILGKPVHVLTACLPDRDATIYRLRSSLLSDGGLAVSIRFSYPTGAHSDDANDWDKPSLHTSRILHLADGCAVIGRTLDSTSYYLTLRWEGKASLTAVAPHSFRLTATSGELAFEAYYSPCEPSADDLARFSFPSALKTVRQAWKDNWEGGGFVDFSHCRDPRAPELQRRVLLSQYLTLINCAGGTPPAETGLTCNSWFGRPHLEMAWWHTVHFSLWGRSDVLARTMQWYSSTAYPKALAIARRQNYKGARWMKMTDPWAGEAPSKTGSFLIWQQPHAIYMAEELYRAAPTHDTLLRYAELVEQTALWMADFATRDSVSGTCQLRGATAMQESMTKDISYNHPFELAYWRYGLLTAQKWRERLGQARRPEWDSIVSHLSPLPQSDGIYTAGEPLRPASGGPSTEDFLLRSRSDHPAALGVCGLLPTSLVPAAYTRDTMDNTLEWVLRNWKWETAWGWDYGMMAMAAARLNHPGQALDILLSDQPKNRYLLSGHNFQTPQRLRLYLPGNGALLTAVAMMCAGWDGAPPNSANPGFPHDGNWDVRWEGLKPMQ